MLFEKDFMSKNSRKATSKEIADSLALPLQKVELLMKCSLDVTSGDQGIYQNRGKMISNGNDDSVKDRLQSGTNNPFVNVQRLSLNNELRSYLSMLNDREAEIIQMRFGLIENTSPMTLEDIGKHFNVTRERIRQIEARAMSKLRQPIHNSDMKELIVVESSNVGDSTNGNSAVINADLLFQ